MRFAPQYTEFLLDPRDEKHQGELPFIIRPVTLFRAFLNVSRGVTTRITANVSHTITDRNLDKMLDQCSRYNLGPLLVFPEVLLTPFNEESNENLSRSL
jgi:hypothetical protein